jgi:hypothetical protein
MALNPSSRYPSQIDTDDAGYPRGKARNAGSYQDGTGTPLEKDWVNDLFGFQQALLDAANIVPSGIPDEVGASQYLTALVTIGSRVLSGETFTVEGGGTILLQDDADLNVVEGAAINVSGVINIDSGGHIDVDSGADINLASGSDLNVASGGDINVVTGGEINVTGTVNIDAGGVIAVDGNINLATGAIINVNDDARINVNSGGEIQFNPGSTLDVNVSSDFAAGTTMVMRGAISIPSGGSISVTSADVNVNSGAQILLNGGSLILGASGTIQANGGDVTLGSGSLLTVDAAANIMVSDSAEGWRHTLTPAFHDGLNPWARTTDASGVLGWYQTDVGARRSIWFALPFLPGDTLVNLFVRVQGDVLGLLSHGGVAPDTQASIELITVDINGVPNVEASTNDAASGATYDSPHNIVLANGVSGIMPHVVTTDPLYLRVRGEIGGSAAIGLGILSISGNIIARSYRPASMVY